jgi:NADH-quinone oxidoreductase subunit H
VGLGQPLLAARRAPLGRQVISYEIVLGLSLVGIFILSGSLSLRDIVAAQQTNLDIFGLEISNWYILSQPVAFIIFMIAAVAETNRAPFDLPRPSPSSSPASTPSTPPSASPSTSWASTSR